MAEKSITRERVLELVREADTIEDLGQLVLDEFAVDVCEGCDNAGYLELAKGESNETRLCLNCIEGWEDY